MKLNALSPAPGSKKKPTRLGRGIGSGLGKTSGRGHKGQKARAGGFHKINFEGGQMPIQRRLPKLGFKSRVKRYTAEMTLSEIAKASAETITLEALKSEGMVIPSIKQVKVIASGEISKAISLKGIAVTKGAREAIEKAGGRIEV